MRNFLVNFMKTTVDVLLQSSVKRMLKYATISSYDCKYDLLCSFFVKPCYVQHAQVGMLTFRFIPDHFCIYSFCFTNCNSLMGRYMILSQEGRICIGKRDGLKRSLQSMDSSDYPMDETSKPLTSQNKEGYFLKNNVVNSME